MLFNSLTFAVFLPVVVGLFWIVPRTWRAALLLAASYVFYGAWDTRFLSLLLISTLGDYWIGRAIHRTDTRSTRRWLLAASLTINLGILGFFKYWDFFIESAGSALDSIGFDPGFVTLRIVLPVGISFYTFQTLSYTVDIFRRQLEPERSLVRFALFVAFFPQLVAGPIERARRLLPQLRSFPNRPQEVAWASAGALIARGLFRKLVIADGLAPIVDEVYSKPGSYSSVTVVLALVAFSLQIYGDFAGYTDIARGVARLFGVELMENFRAPYRAEGFSHFWRRWHISLSTWLRDYLYIPLGGSREGTLRTYFNLMATMLLGGLWHGAGWGFVIWGGLHGGYLVFERWRMGSRSQRWSRLPPLLVFAVVTLTWIPFRSPDLDTALLVWRSLFDFGGQALALAPVSVGILGLLTVLLDHFDLRDIVNPVRSLPAFARGATYGLALVIGLLYASQTATPFLYFQF